MSGGSDHLTTRASIFLKLKNSQRQPRELAWEQFRARYAPVIAGFARNLGAKPQDVDDVIQDVMLGFFAQSPTFVYDPAKGRFRGYLKVCTIRALRKRAGQNLKFQGVPLDDVDPESAKVDQTWNELWEHERLRRAMEQLRIERGQSRTFAAFEQHVIKNKPAEQVSRELGMHLSSVYRAKEQMMQLVRQRLREDGAD